MPGGQIWPRTKVWRDYRPFYSLSRTTERALELVKDAIVLVKVAQLLLQMLVDVDLPDRLLLVPDVPDLQSQVISRQNLVTVFGKFDVRDGRDDLGEE